MLEVKILVSNAYEHMDRYCYIKFFGILLIVIPYLFIFITSHYTLPFDIERASFYSLGPVSFDSACFLFSYPLFLILSFITFSFLLCICSWSQLFLYGLYSSLITLDLILLNVYGTVVDIQVPHQALIYMNSCM